jgi:hypothetical protein
MRADVQEAVVPLHDFTFRDPREILAGLAGTADNTVMQALRPIVSPL